MLKPDQNKNGVLLCPPVVFPWLQQGDPFLMYTRLSFGDGDSFLSSLTCLKGLSICTLPFQLFLSVSRFLWRVQYSNVFLENSCFKLCLLLFECILNELILLGLCSFSLCSDSLGLEYWDKIYPFHLNTFCIIWYANDSV